MYAQVMKNNKFCDDNRKIKTSWKTDNNAECHYETLYYISKCMKCSTFKKNQKLNSLISECSFFQGYMSEFL
jgi:hypothetical protein